MMRLIMMVVLMSLVVGCTQPPTARPPVVDASWRATDDDRRVIPMTPPDRTREAGESNQVIPVEPIARIEPIDQPATESTMSPAVLSLLEQADSLRAAGDLAGASSRLERAQRIAPTEPEIYFQLSSVRLEQGSYEDAANIASQALDLAGADSAMKRDLYTLIARAREALGDGAGASEARRLARTFGS
jgi:tetratricopeptide (TPR) repeat protein